MARIDKIKQALRQLEPEDKIDFHNLRSQEMVNGEDDIYPNDEDFFNMFYANDPFNAVQRAVYGDYKPMHDYVMFNGYGNLQSLDTYLLDKHLYSDEDIAEFLDENPQYIEDYNLEIEEEEPNEVSEDQYYDALEVLPPFYFDVVNGKKVSGGFAVGEPTTHTQTPIGMRATYSGYYKSGDKYFGLGQVYFVIADEQGEPDMNLGNDDVEVKTLDPDAFAKGGGVRRPLFSNREYSFGSAWTNDHRHQNKKEDYEVPMPDRKRKYATGGGVRNLNGREYSFGRNWTNDHRHENRREDWEVPQADRVRKFAGGGGIELTDKQKKIDMNQNGRIDAEDFAILRKSMNGAWRNEHKHVNHSEKHETRYAKKTGSTRTGYKGRKEYGGGGSTDKPKEPIAFETSNLYYNGKGIDINGNSVVRVSFPNSRAFSIQTNGTLPKTHSDGYDEVEINEYVRDYGSPAQKKKLKIYKK